MLPDCKHWTTLYELQASEINPSGSLCNPSTEGLLHRLHLAVKIVATCFYLLPTFSSDSTRENLMRFPKPGPVRESLHCQVCHSHRDIASALEVWKQQPTVESPEHLFRLRGGGGPGLLHRYFGPADRALPLPSCPADSPRAEQTTGWKHAGQAIPATPADGAAAMTGPPPTEAGKQLLFIRKCQVGPVKAVPLCSGLVADKKVGCYRP